MMFIAGLGYALFGDNTAGGSAAPGRGADGGLRARASALAQPAVSFGTNLFAGRTSQAFDTAQPTDDSAKWKAAERVASFSCSGQLSAARLLVCSDLELATTDYNLGIVYRNALQRSGGSARLRATQARWMTELDGIADDPKRIAAHYQLRVSQLSAE